jgi:hypothetical protein
MGTRGVFLFLLFTVISSVGRAEEVPICEQFKNLYKYSCTDLKTNFPYEASLRWGEIETQAQNYAIANSKTDGTEPYFHYLKNFHTKMDTLALGELGVGVADLRTLAESVRIDMLAVVEASPNILPEGKEKFKRSIRAVQVLLPSEYLDVGRPEEVEAALTQVCGRWGVVANGFYDAQIGSSVVICPLFTLEFAQIVKTFTPLEKLQSLRLFLGHEIGHAVNLNNLGLTTYLKNYVNCQYKQARENPDLFPQNFSAKLREMLSDTWAAEAFAVEYINSKTKADVFKILLSNLAGNFCGTIENEEHPAGVFRTNVTMARNHSLLELFGCEGPEACPIF